MDLHCALYGVPKKLCNGRRKRWNRRSYARVLSLGQHWANRDALLIDVLRNHSDKLPDFNSDNPRDDMVQFIRYLAESRKREELGPVWPRIIGYAASNPDFARAMRAFAFEPRRVQVERIIERAIDKGELRAGIDAAFAMDLLVGPVMHRRFS
jgi:hypothetical protein